MARRGSSSTVRSQMPKMSLARQGNAGIYGHNKAPFTEPQSMGNGSIPTKFFDEMGEKPAAALRTASAGMADASGGNNRERKSMTERRFRG